MILPFQPSLKLHTYIFTSTEYVKKNKKSKWSFCIHILFWTKFRVSLVPCEGGRHLKHTLYSPACVLDDGITIKLSRKFVIKYQNVYPEL